MRYRSPRRRAAVVSALVLSLLAAASSRPVAAQDEPGHADRITGKWEGTYYAFPHAYHLTIELSPAATRAWMFSGTASTSSLVEQRGARGPEPATFTVTATYDPAVDTVALRLRPASRPVRGAMMQHDLIGVVDPRDDRIGGRFVVRGASVPHFVLAREGSAQPLLDAMRGAFARGPTGRKLKNAPSNESLIAWAARLQEEYPQQQPSRGEMSSLVVRSYGLFEDAYFHRHFGVTFDEMSPTQRRAVNQRLAQPSDRAIAEYSWLSRPFGGAMSQGTPEVMGAVLAQRIIRRWRDDGLARMRAQPVELDAFDRIDAFQQASKPQLALLWPSERSEVVDTCDATRRRVADPLTAKRAEHAVGTAKGYAGAVALGRWSAENARLLTWASPEVREAAVRKVTARLDEVLEPLVAAEVARLDSVEHNTAGLRRTSDWYRSFRARYGFARARPAFGDAVRRLQDVRAAQLLEVKDSATQLIERMGVESEIDGFVAWLMPVPSDLHSPGGRAIRAAAGARISHLRAERARKAKAQWMALAALLAEGLKLDAEDHDDAGGAVLAVMARDFLIEESIRNALPKLPEEYVVKARIYIAAVLDGRTDEKSIEREKNFESFLEKLRSETPDHPWSDEAAKALWETMKRFKRR
jgi:hypothetical protein